MSTNRFTEMQPQATNSQVNNLFSPPVNNGNVRKDSDVPESVTVETPVMQTAGILPADDSRLMNDTREEELRNTDKEIH